MKHVVTHPEAEAELEATAKYYEQRRSGLGRQFLDEFEAALGRLLDNPQQYAIEISEIRACPLHRFPYTIYYVEFEDRIWLAAIAHQHRRPGYWMTRRPD